MDFGPSLNQHATVHVRKNCSLTKTFCILGSSCCRYKSTFSNQERLFDRSHYWWHISSDPACHFHGDFRSPCGVHHASEETTKETSSRQRVNNAFHVLLLIHNYIMVLLLNTEYTCLNFHSNKMWEKV